MRGPEVPTLKEDGNMRLIRFSPLFIFFGVLLMIMRTIYQSEAMEVVKDINGVQPDHHQVPHMGHMDPSHYVFFMEKDLKIGKTVPIYFPYSSASPPFLPKEEADSIPFSSSQLPHLLKRFSFTSNSTLAKAIQATLTHCELKPIKGETKICATSLESMLDFTRAIFGPGTRFRALTTRYHGKRKTDPVLVLQNYTIMEFSREKETLAEKMVACHIMPYPYAVLYCHHLGGGSKVFRVLMVGDGNGDRVEAIAACHMDTSQWNLDHVSFHMLGIERGTVPVCHFFPENNFVWVPSSSLITSN